SDEGPALPSGCSQPHGVRLPSHTLIGNVDVAVAGSQIGPREVPHCGVGITAGVVVQSSQPHGDVVVTIIGTERVYPVGSVVDSGSVFIESAYAVRGVEAPGAIDK